MSATHTASRIVAALRSGRMPSSSIVKNVAWSGIPYTLSRNNIILALCAGWSPGGAEASMGAPAPWLSAAES